MKKVIRYAFRFILGFILSILLYLLCAWILPYFQVNKNFKETPGGVEIFVQSNGVHTDIVVPAANNFYNWRKHFPVNDFKQVDSSYQYISFGWGDKGFYIETPEWKDLTFSIAFKAVFFLSSTAMHVTYHKYKPKESGLCKKITISTDQYNKLLQYITNSFLFKNGNVIKIAHLGYGVNDAFYEAKGTYSFLKTCNCWTGNGLKQAGLKVGVWTPFQSGVLNSLK